MSQSEFPINLEMNSGWSMITETENQQNNIKKLHCTSICCDFQNSFINQSKMKGESGASNLLELIGDPSGD